MKLSSTGLAIELTPDESELFSALPSYNELANDWDGEWSEAADAMEELYLLLKDRGVIPELRLKIFIDPQYAEKGALLQKLPEGGQAKAPDQFFRSGKCGESMRALQQRRV